MPLAAAKPIDCGSTGLLNTKTIEAFGGIAGIAGIEDFYGNPVPDKIWSFTTGSTVDFDNLTVLDQSIPSVDLSLRPAIPAIPPNASMVLVFSKPVDPQSIGFAAASGIGLSVPLRAEFSDDLQTVTFTPESPFPRGQQFSLYVNGLVDL